MFKNYVTTAFRNLFRNKLYSAINIGGLAIGLAAALLIMLFVRDEFSWDSWVPEAERIARVELMSYPAGREPFHLAVTFTPFKDFLEQDFPEIEAATRLRYSTRTVSREGKYFSEETAFADPNFFEVFDFPFMAGDGLDVFGDPSSVAISESTAMKYFGETPALGQSLMLDNGKLYKVSGVFKDLPANTHMTLDLVFPFTYAEFPATEFSPSILDEWFNLGTYIYVKLDRPESATLVQAGFPVFLDARAPRPSETTIPSERWNLSLVNIRDIHLDGAPLARIKPQGSRTGALIFSSIALLILLIGCFNFINLSTARASLRAHEVALRKVVGASRKQLFTQFLSEAGLIVLFAFAVSLALVEFVLPWYNSFIQKVLILNLTSDPIAMAGLFGLLLIVILGAGGPPAITISSIRPAEILKSGGRQGGGSTWFRSLLVGFQFAIAIALIISSVVVYSQVSFGLNRDMGFNKDNILILSKIGDSKVRPLAEELKAELLAHPDIISASFSSVVPGDSGTTLDGYSDVNGQSVDTIIVNLMSIDNDFFSNYEISFMGGRDYALTRSADVSRALGGDFRDSSVIINEAAMRKFGFGSVDEALGSTIGGEFVATIVGVVANTKTGSARTDIKPYVYFIDQEDFGRLSLRYTTDNMESLLKDVDTIWSKFMPEIPISRTFLDERIEAQYQGEEARGFMFAIFASLAVIVASLGLYGLSAFTIEQKTKEIGIRKVMGASVPTIVRQLVWQSSKPVILANFIAWPVAWFFMNNWLLGFADRIDLTPLPFLLAGGLALLIGWFSVAGHAWFVARTNPIHALRYE